MPCDYKRDYHPEWKTKIRPDILERDGNCCKFCGVQNYSYIFRDDMGGWFYCDDWLKVKENGGGFYLTKGDGRIKIVLTIMHLDHDTKNNDYENLAAGCQKCHLNYDKKHHAKNSKETRRKKKGLQELFPNQQVR